MVNITGFGKIMADDPCWDNRPQETEGNLEGWEAMLKKDDAEKRAAGCLCMGSAIFEKCAKFPGVLSTEFYDDPAKAARLIATFRTQHRISFRIDVVATHDHLED